MTKFAQYVMRTLDVDAARSFYKAVLGHDRAAVVRLHEQAIARGAPPHWLGVLGVRDVLADVEAFTALGAQHLGGTPEFASMRDPGGAVFGMSSEMSTPSVNVGWHVLNTNDLELSVKAYASVCAWKMTDTLNMGSLGSFRNFAWDTGEPNIGSVGSTHGRPGVHAHWLFQFSVADFESALAAVTESQGVVVQSVTGPTGTRVAVCEDPQGAAFGLRDG